MEKCIFDMLLLVQTYIPTMCIFIFFNERLKKCTVAELSFINNVWSRYFIYKGNILLILSQLYQFNTEQNLTNCSSFTSHMFLTIPRQPPPPTPPLHPLVLIFSAPCLNPLCICPFLGIVIQFFWSCQFSCWGIARYTPPSISINKPSLLNLFSLFLSLSPYLPPNHLLLGL